MTLRHTRNPSCCLASSAVKSLSCRLFVICPSAPHPSLASRQFIICHQPASTYFCCRCGNKGTSTTIERNRNSSPVFGSCLRITTEDAESFVCLPLLFSPRPILCHRPTITSVTSLGVFPYLNPSCVIFCYSNSSHLPPSSFHLFIFNKTDLRALE